MERGEHVAKPFTANPKNQVYLAVLFLAIALGVASGYLFSNKQTATIAGLKNGKPTTANAPAPQQDSATFKDFAEGVIQPKPDNANGEYSEGTHLLEREGAAPVALTSSVVDLSKYEGKKVKVFGETQKALDQGWLMDVGKIEEE